MSENVPAHLENRNKKDLGFRLRFLGGPKDSKRSWNEIIARLLRRATARSASSSTGLVGFLAFHRQVIADPVSQARFIM